MEVTQVVENKLAQAVQYLNEEQIDEALQIFEEIIEVDPLQVTAQIGAGVCYLDQGNYELAEDALQKAKRLDRKQGVIYYHLGNVKFAQGDFRAGLELYAQAKENGYESARYHYRVGLLHSSFRDFSAAIDSYTEGLRIEPGNYLLLTSLAEAYEAVSDYSRVRAVGEYIISLYPEEHAGYALVYKAVEETEGSEAGLEYLKSVAEQNPENAQLSFLKSSALLQLNYYNAAIAELNRCESLNRDETVSPRAIMMMRANIYGLLDRTEDYRDELENARIYSLSLDPPEVDTECNHLLGKLYLDEGDPESALICFERNMNANVTSSFARTSSMHAAVCLFMLNRAEDANEYLNLSLKAMDTLLPFAEIYEDVYFVLAYTHFLLGNEEEAMKYIDEYLKVNEYSIDAVLLKGTLLNNAGHTEEADEWFAKGTAGVTEIYKVIEGAQAAD